MNFPALRRYIRSKNLQESYSLQGRDLVIDAHSFFKNTYKDSGCQFVLGPDCDQYADYLISKLTCFLESNIKCHVIFRGNAKGDMTQRQKKHQSLIDDIRNIEFNLDNPKYFEPLFVKDVQKQVLEEMGIKYFCCEYDSIEAIVGVARGLKCPVVTDNVEYCMFKVSCILPNSIVYKEDTKALQCTIFEHHNHQAMFGVFIKTPLLLSVLSQNMEFVRKISELSCNGEYEDIPAVIRWVKRQPKDVDISKSIQDESARKSFMEIYERIKILFLYPSNNLAVKYFRRQKPYGLFKDDKKWFSKGVSDGRIGLAYVDIKRHGVLTGSKIVNDINQTDAMLAADKIITYNHSLLSNSRKTAWNFIGRKNTDCSIWELERHWTGEISNRELFLKSKYNVHHKSVYLEFFKGIRPGHDVINVLLSTKVPQNCWILVITLVYYIENVNEDFVDGAYFILLSYLLLGPVSKALHEFKNGDLSEDSDIYKDTKAMYDKFQFLFRKVDLKTEFNTAILHKLAEFQHCLEHMNCLNNICGQSNRRLKIPSTVYHDTYNATFIYNAFTVFRNKDNLMKYMEENFNETQVCVKFYKNIVTGLEMCRHPTPEMLYDEDKVLRLQFVSVKE